MSEWIPMYWAGVEMREVKRVFARPYRDDLYEIQNAPEHLRYARFGSVIFPAEDQAWVYLHEAHRARLHFQADALADIATKRRERAEGKSGAAEVARLKERLASKTETIRALEERIAQIDRQLRDQHEEIQLAHAVLNRWSAPHADGDAVSYSLPDRVDAFICDLKSRTKDTP